MSFTKALMQGKPVIFTGENILPDVICPEGAEKEALEMMVDMGLIKLTRPQKVVTPALPTE